MPDDNYSLDDDLETWDEWDDWEDDDGYEDNGDPCNDCGPSCEHWGGDGLCMLAIEQQAEEGEEYAKKHIHENIECPVCGKNFTQYNSPADRLWVWPSDCSPFIPLSIYGVMDITKGEIHRQGNLCHIFIGTGENRQEKLILLEGKNQDEK